MLRDGKPSVAAAAGEAVRRLAGAVCGALGRAAAEAAAERTVVVVAAEVLPAVVAGIGCLQWRSQLLAAALSVVADWCASPSIGEAFLLGMMFVYAQCSVGTFISPQRCALAALIPYFQAQSVGSSSAGAVLEIFCGAGRSEMDWCPACIPTGWRRAAPTGRRCSTAPAARGWRTTFCWTCRRGRRSCRTPTRPTCGTCVFCGDETESDVE